MAGGMGLNFLVTRILSRGEFSSVAKLKNPLLSFEAHKTLGGSVTFQTRPGLDLLRSKPVPAYRYTLPIAYQRWLYEDYCFLWQQQSPATRRAYATAGVPYHLTAFQYWMKYHLKNLPDIMAMWHLDEKTGAIARDSSRYQTHGSIIGASPAGGLIGGAQYFTLNDFIRITTPQLNFTSGNFSIVAHIKVESFVWYHVILHRGGHNEEGWRFYFNVNGGLIFATSQAGTSQTTWSFNDDLVAGTWADIGMSRHGNSVRLFVGGVDRTRAADNHLDPVSSNRSAKIGIDDDEASLALEGTLDHLIVFDRYLSPEEHKRRAGRRYPP